jgi:hypothetical protein
MAAAKQEWRAKFVAKEEELAEAKVSSVSAWLFIPSDLWTSGSTAGDHFGIGIFQGFQHCRIFKRAAFAASQGIIRR